MVLLKNNIKIINYIEKADNLFKRIKGLIGKKDINVEYGLFIPHCNSIHTFFMSTIIDVVMVDKNFKVIYIKEKVKPFKFAFCFNAFHTFEFAAGTVQDKEIKKEDREE
jgi:uncharacterized membrane protein (UPF0127 family)